MTPTFLTRQLPPLFKGTCGRGIYDNMKIAAIFVGKERRYNRRLMQMWSRYLASPLACTSASGSERLGEGAGQEPRHLCRPVLQAPCGSCVAQRPLGCASTTTNTRSTAGAVGRPIKVDRIVICQEGRIAPNIHDPFAAVRRPTIAGIMCRSGPI